MVRPVVLGLLLACAASLCESETITEADIPTFWDGTVERVADMPKKGEVVNPDPWYYPDRLSFFRVMQEATKPYMGPMGPNATDSIFWGLPMQLYYIKKSERLADPTGQTTCGAKTGDTKCISPKSWWSCESYFTSVLSFLSAAKQNMFGDNVEVEMKRPAGADEYCTTYAQCLTEHEDAMNKWDAFFQSLKTSSASTQSDIVKKDYILGLFWDAQMASKNISNYKCRDRQSAYSSVEADFAQSWLESAVYLSSSHFYSNFKNSAQFVNPLPSRILKETDVPPNIADLSILENHTLATYSWMKSIDSVIDGTMVKLWKRAMCSVTSRQKAQDLLQQLMMNANYQPGTFVATMAQLSIGCWGQ